MRLPKKILRFFFKKIIIIDTHLSQQPSIVDVDDEDGIQPKAIPKKASIVDVDDEDSIHPKAFPKKASRIIESADGSDDNDEPTFIDIDTEINDSESETAEDELGK